MPALQVPTDAAVHQPRGSCLCGLCTSTPPRSPDILNSPPKTHSGLLSFYFPHFHVWVAVAPGRGSNSMGNEGKLVPEHQGALQSRPWGWPEGLSSEAPLPSRSLGARVFTGTTPTFAHLLAHLE